MILQSIETPQESICLNLRQGGKRASLSEEFTKRSYNFSTGFPLPLWKVLLLSLACLLSFSCAHLQEGKGVERGLDALIGLSEADVRERLGPPSVIAKSKEGTVLWFYIPSFKVIPDGRGEVYVEFEGGRVKRVVRK